jgi:hypothetical protein
VLVVLGAGFGLVGAVRFGRGVPERSAAYGSDDDEDDTD